MNWLVRALLWLICWVCCLCSNAQTPYVPNGGVFTPHGQLRVLLVFVVSKDNPASNPQFTNAAMPVNGWDMQRNGGLPETVNARTGEAPELMFSQTDEFQTRLDSVVYNYSKDFYLMSLGKFQLMGEVFRDSNNVPTVVPIDMEGCGWWTCANKRAWEAMQQLNPKMNFARFDQRRNAPNFLFDNSDTTQSKPDKVIDYVVFIHRYALGAPLPPVWGMERWAGSGGGFAGTGLGMEQAFNGYQCNEGFTMCYNSGVFIHEIGHTLHNAPHLFGANKVVGEYFYRPSVGWGFTSILPIFKGGFTAWERWYLGYIEPIADIKSIDNEVKTFRLRDFVTTGDAARIELPHSNGQYIWLENHTGAHVFDSHPWTGAVLQQDTLANTPTGIYAYIEAIADRRDKIINALSDKANAIKLLNANGNYDYELVDTPAFRNAWGNEIYTWRRGRANPLSGLNPYYHQPLDADKDKIIAFDRNYNQGKGEYTYLAREEIQTDSFINLYACFGVYDAVKNANYARVPTFGGGDVLDMASNPALVNYPRYSMPRQTLDTMRLSGLEISFANVPASADKLVTVRYRQTILRESVRWTGILALPNITQDTAADLVIGNGKRIWLDHSGTPNRHTQTERGDFVNPTHFRIEAGAALEIEAGGTLYIDNNSTLSFAEGAELRMGKRAKLIVEPSATLILNEKALKRHQKSKIIVRGVWSKPNEKR